MFLNCFLVQSFVVKPRFCGVSPFVIKTISIHIHRDNFFGSIVEWILSVCPQTYGLPADSDHPLSLGSTSRRPLDGDTKGKMEVPPPPDVGCGMVRAAGREGGKDGRRERGSDTTGTLFPPPIFSPLTLVRGAPFRQ